MYCSQDVFADLLMTDTFLAKMVNLIQLKPLGTLVCICCSEHSIGIAEEAVMPLARLRLGHAVLNAPQSRVSINVSSHVVALG